jgi:hypothetical protein
MYRNASQAMRSTSALAAIIAPNPDITIHFLSRVSSKNCFQKYASFCTLFVIFVAFTLTAMGEETLAGM